MHTRFIFAESSGFTYKVRVHNTAGRDALRRNGVEVCG